MNAAAKSIQPGMASAFYLRLVWIFFGGEEPPRNKSVIPQWPTARWPF